MPVPVTIVEAGGFPITETDLGTPLTPTDGESANQPLAMPVTIVPSGGMPAVLVNDDLSPWEAPE